MFLRRYESTKALGVWTNKRIGLGVNLSQSHRRWEKRVEDATSPVTLSSFFCSLKINERTESKNCRAAVAEAILNRPQHP